MMKCNEVKTTMECVKTMEKVLIKKGIHYIINNVYLEDGNIPEYYYGTIELFHEGIFSTIEINDGGFIYSFVYGKYNRWNIKESEKEKWEFMEWVLQDIYYASFHLEEYFDKEIIFYERILADSEDPEKLKLYAELCEKYRAGLTDHQYHINARYVFPGAGLYQLNPDLYEKIFEDAFDNFYRELKRFHDYFRDVERKMEVK